MSVRIEFYGVPRHRAGVATIDVVARTLGEALSAVEAQLPQLHDVCITQGQLCRGYLANLNGRQFVHDTNQALTDGDCVLLLSADVGG